MAMKRLFGCIGLVVRRHYIAVMTAREDSILSKLQNCVQSIGHTPNPSPIAPATTQQLAQPSNYRQTTHLRK